MIYEDNPSNLLDNIPYLVALTSFLPVQQSEQQQARLFALSQDHKRPICIEPLQDLTIKAKEKIVLSCKFYSEEPHTVTWRGPAIAAKRGYKVTVNRNSLFFSHMQMTVHCVEGVQYASARRFHFRN